MSDGNAAPIDQMSVRVRRMRPRDAAMAGAMMIADLRMSSALANALPSLLHNLLTTGRLTGFCLEGARAGEPKAKGFGSIVAFGLSGFLSDACVEAFLNAPVAYFAMDLLESCIGCDSSSVLLGLDAVARANAGNGLNLTPICWVQRPRYRANTQGVELMALNKEIFLKQHLGYNLKCLVKEIAAHEEARFVAAGYTRVKKLNAIDGTERVALVLTREQAERGEFGSAFGILFSSSRPRLGFTPIQQQVLDGALDGLSDQEIADDLGLSAHGINMRWRTIYRRIEEQPEVATAVFRGTTYGTAGSVQKRRRVIAFVRAHPEELRPFAPVSISRTERAT
jgi:hypothetical protein